MADFVTVAAVFVFLVVIRLLHLTIKAEPPFLYYKDSEFNRAILKLCPLLLQPYVPTLIWGKSGHIQTILYGKMGRVKSPMPKGRRMSHIMPDGATSTFDIFEPHKEHPQGDFTMLFCPGIANSSESLYIRTCVDHAQNHGYRVAVLNHLGAPKTVPLTSPRIFTYGHTDEYGVMVDTVRHMHPHTKCMAVGFSMGGNLVMKYLGETKANQDKFVCCISCCQGYDAEEYFKEMLNPDCYWAGTYLMGWERCRRVYLWAISQNLKSILKRHYKVLFGPAAKEKYGPDLEEDKVFSALNLVAIDTHFSIKRAGFNNVQEYYRWSSCRYYIDNITIPCFILNALDDPIVPEPLLETAKNFYGKRDNVIFATTKHGGHLGYFEGNHIVPDSLTWLDKIVVQFADAMTITTPSENKKCV